MDFEQRPTNDRSVGALVSELATESRTLFRQELALFRVEMSRKIQSIGKESSYLVIGGVLGIVGLELLLGASALGLGLLIPLWLSLLLIGVVVVGVAAGLAWHGWSALRRIELSPPQPIQSFEDNKTWAKTLIQ